MCDAIVLMGLKSKTLLDDGDGLVKVTADEPTASEQIITHQQGKQDSLLNAIVDSPVPVERADLHLLHPQLLRLAFLFLPVYLVGIFRTGEIRCAFLEL